MKNLFLLIVILGAAFYYWDRHAEYRPEWLLKLVADSGILNTSVSMDLDRDTDFSEQSLRRHFGHLYLSCDPQITKMGDRVCWTYISEFNGIPAEMISSVGYGETRPRTEAHRRDSAPSAGCSPRAR